MNGDLKRVEGRTGVVIYTYAAARTTHTMHPSGLEVFEFPNGQVGMRAEGPAFRSSIDERFIQSFRRVSCMVEKSIVLLHLQCLGHLNSIVAVYCGKQNYTAATVAVQGMGVQVLLERPVVYFVARCQLPR